MKNSGTVETDVCAFATTSPNTLIANINYERMPIILTSEEHIKTWLKAKPEEAYHLLNQYPAE